MADTRGTLIAETVAAARSWRFWEVVARNCIAPTGVFVFDWPAMTVVLYFLVEVWLFVSLRMSFEVAVDKKLHAGTWLGTPDKVVLNGLKLFCVGAPLFGVVIGVAAMPILAFAARHEGGWRGVVEEAARDPGGLFAGTAVILVFLMVESIRFAVRFQGRSEEQEAVDEYRGASMVMKLVCLLAAGVVAVFLPWNSGGKALVLVIALTSVWIEGVPGDAARRFGYKPRLPPLF